MLLPTPLAVPADIPERAKKDTIPALGANPLAISPAATAPVEFPTAIVPEATGPETTVPATAPPVATSLPATSPDALGTQVQGVSSNPPADLAFEARVIPKVADAHAPAPPASVALPLKQVAYRREPENSDAGDGSEPGGSPENSKTAIAPSAAVSSRFSTASESIAQGPAASPQIREPAQAEPAPSAVRAHLRELTVRIAAPGGLPVDVQVNQRGGEMRVVVRTADGGMQLSLRQDLPQLVNALDRAGFRAQTFTTHQAADSLLAPGAASSGETLAGSSSRDLSRDPSQDASCESGGKDSSFSSREREQQQQQQRQREHMHRGWLQQMEE